ncbi:RNA polymerase sigma factor [Candidatus Sumerlaeota bacterium]|nr:RNA polymerase sigma factor [Candidatus Sumerlaeota bacterium]
MELDNVQINVTNKGYADISEEKVRAIVQDILSGNKERFEEIFGIYHGLVYGMAWNLTGDYDDALDVTQECFLRAFRSLCSWKGKAKFSTWLHRIAVNTSIDYIRREAKHHSNRIDAGDNKDLDREIALISQGVESKTPLTKLQQKELRMRIYDAINRLKGMQRHCFVLRYFADLSIREVAVVAGCAEGTAKRHLFRAREYLRHSLFS